MRLVLSAFMRHAAEAALSSNSEYWSGRLKDVYGLEASVESDPIILRQIYRIMSLFPPSLVRDCGINKIEIREDMGPNKPYYPNHGYFIHHLVALNADIFRNPDLPDDFFDHRGYFLTRPEQTLIHEFGHGYDAHHDDLSLKPAWLKLSGWNEKPLPGLTRLIIRDPGAPEVIGEWFYDPQAGFTRFYAKRNPWDDWADCFSFYVGGLRDKMPLSKREYFDDLLSKHYD